MSFLIYSTVVVMYIVVLMMVMENGLFYLRVWVNIEDLGPWVEVSSLSV